MYIRGLRDRIPANVRGRAKKAGFREPDWYAGPLVDSDTPDTAFENSDTPLDQPMKDLDLAQELDQEIEKATHARQMKATRPSLFSRLPRPWGHPARQADAR